MPQWFEDLTKTLADEKLTRRQSIRRVAGVIASVAFASFISNNPVLASVGLRVRRGVSTCSGGNCTNPGTCSNGNFPNCGSNQYNNCYCFQDMNGSAVCGCNTYCASAQPCSQDTDCGTGYFCITNTGCGCTTGLCIPTCNQTCQLQSEYAGRTAAGQNQSERASQTDSSPIPEVINTTVTIIGPPYLFSFKPTEIATLKPGDTISFYNSTNDQIRFWGPDASGQPGWIYVGPGGSWNAQIPAGAWMYHRLEKAPGNEQSGVYPSDELVPDPQYKKSRKVQGVMEEGNPPLSVIVSPNSDPAYYSPVSFACSSQNSPAFNIQNGTSVPQTVTWTDNGGGNVTLAPNQTQGICLEGPGMYTLSLSSNSSATLTVTAS